VIVIVGILAIVAVPIYRGYTRRAMASEGRTLVGSIQTSQKVYYAEQGKFVTVSNTSYDSVLDIDARANKYFTSFDVTGSATGFTAATTASTTSGASGITVSLTGSSTAQAITNESGI
ncbi:MAG: hypothetical protein FWC57_06695, partial [Endomicrobia bacterium]|nr:hypothetical protein [Endomicrobiia bacterium]